MRSRPRRQRQRSKRRRTCPRAYPPTRMATPRGTDLLHDPRRNKSTAFSAEERERLGLLGLLPEGIDDLDTQLRRALAQLDGKTTDLERYIYLSQLQDTDETLSIASSCPIPRDSCRSYTRRRSARPVRSSGTSSAGRAVSTSRSNGRAVFARSSETGRSTTSAASS